MVNNLQLKKMISNHFEWFFFTAALSVVAFMNPYVDQGTSLCFFDLLGFNFCPGEGLAHSIAFFFRGDIANALNANVMGPIATFVILSRIIYLLYQNLITDKYN